jgi:hypothetical protein
MSPYTTVELADEEEHLAQKIERELFSLLPLTQKLLIFLPFVFIKIAVFNNKEKRKRKRAKNPFLSIREK